MKIVYGSDLHLEFQKTKSQTPAIPESDVLLLAGDIFCPWSMSKTDEAIARSFFDDVAEKSKVALIILGNHEHYDGYFLNTNDKVGDFLSKYTNVHLLNNQSFDYENVRFFGSTFWTDMRGSHPEVMWDAQRGMSDFSLIKYSEDRYTPYKSGGARLRAEDLVNENHYSRHSLTEFMTGAEKDGVIPVVMTHHAPCYDRCTEACYKMDSLSYAYANTGMTDLLDELFPEFHWIHGHMHKREIFQTNKGTVYCNSRGYHGFEPTKFVSAFKFEELSL